MVRRLFAELQDLRRCKIRAGLAKLETGTVVMKLNNIAGNWMHTHAYAHKCDVTAAHSTHF
jgi:hypothetical protein